MTDDPNDAMRRHPAATPALQAALKALASPETFSPLDDLRQQRFDTVWTEFLRRTIPRANTDSARRRLGALRQMEQLIARQEAGFRIGMQGFLLGSIAREYPVSHSLMRRELRGFKEIDPVEFAEQIELGLWVPPLRPRDPR